MLAAFGPMRRGEICALDSECISGNTVHVMKNMVLDSSRSWMIKSPKFYSGDRYIEFPDFVTNLLAEKSGRITTLTPDALTCRFHRLVKRSGVHSFRFHDLCHPYVKHTTKIFSLRLKVFQAQPVPGALRKTRGAFQHLREGGTRNPVLQSCNKKRSSWSVPQSKMSLILYAISMRLSGYTSTLSMRRSVSSVFSPSEWKTALAASCRLSCRACSSCFCFACANTAA